MEVGALVRLSSWRRTWQVGAREGKVVPRNKNIEKDCVLVKCMVTGSTTSTVVFTS